MAMQRLRIATLTMLGTTGLCAQAVKDTVRLTDGKVETGQVKSEEWNGLALTLANGKNANYAWKQVAAVQYGGAPEFMKAQGAYAAGSVKESLPQFEALYQNKKLRPVVRQHVLFLRAQALQRTSNSDGALAAYKELLTEYPKTQYFVGIGEGYLACFMAKNDLAGAKSALDELSAAAKNAGADRPLQVRIDLFKARVLEAQKNYKDARSAYDSASSGAGLTPDVAAEARVGVGRCLQAEGKGSEAEKLYRELIANKDANNQVLSGAWNGIGDMLKEEGKKSRSPDRLLEALYAYLRGVVQYPPAPGNPTSEYERSLAGAAQCFKHIAELEQDKDRQKLFAQRSRERKAQLEREFPGSPWLQGL
jgi:tetratricopeptide (TPR) repeat protein